MELISASLKDGSEVDRLILHGEEHCKIGFVVNVFSDACARIMRSSSSSSNEPQELLL